MGKKKIPIDAEELARQCTGRWPAIIAAIDGAFADAAQAYESGEATRKRGVSCPVHGGKDGFKFFKDADDTGGGVCNTCGFFPDGYALLNWRNGWSFRETLEAVAEKVGYVPSGTYKPQTAKVRKQEPRKRREEDPRTIRTYLAYLKKAYEERISLTDPSAVPARRYFEKRGTPLESMPWPIENVWYHTNLYYEKGVYSPGIIQLVYDKQGKPVTFQRLWITEEGEKAFGSDSKRAMPYDTNRRSMAGGYVPLAPPHQHLVGVAEGLETAMSCMVGSGLPCWTTINAVNLEALELPQSIQWVVIWGDNDRKGRGQEAASNLYHRLLQEGRNAIMLFPPDLGGEKGTDWNDVLIQKGPDGIPGLDDIRREFILMDRLVG